MLFVAFGLLITLEACGDEASGCLTNAECGAGRVCVNGECAPDERDDGGVTVDAPDLDAQDLDAEFPEDAGPPVPPTCGAACELPNRCEAGAYDCESGEPVCVAVGPAPEGTLCREVEGECDIAEVCDGESTECPSNARVSEGTTCREASGECDQAESCDGESPACPIDVYAPTGEACADGFCDGSGVCSDSCTPGADCDPGIPCRTGRVDCSGGVPSCQIAGEDADGTMCGATENGSWSACSFGDTCAETGTQTRPVTSYACDAGNCGASIEMESRACTRVTTGAGCGSPSVGSWGSCGGFSDACDQTGSRTRTVSTPTCGGGECNVVMTTQSEECSRSTNGNSCGSVSNGSWTTCAYDNTCDESASRSRPVTTPTCNNGSCTDVASTQTEACTRDTDGTTCGSTLTGPYGACSGFTTGCDETGTQTRTVTERRCATGSCTDVPMMQSVVCTRDTDGDSCLGPACGRNVCASGRCDQSGSCPRGDQCCPHGCAPLCFI